MPKPTLAVAPAATAESAATLRCRRRRRLGHPTRGDRARLRSGDRPGRLGCAQDGSCDEGVALQGVTSAGQVGVEGGRERRAEQGATHYIIIYK
eukprot:6458062-Prymnesium_polylepis.1